MDIFRIRMSAPSFPSFGPAMLPLEGDVLLDRYRVIRQIGAGGMGVVYEGVHLRTERRVAIKCLNPEWALDPESLRRFEWEAKGATSIGNSHIVDVIDMDALPNGVHFIVLEYLDGADLGHELKTRGPFQVHRAVSVILQMCEALALVHDKGIIHRDLKPSNVLLIERDGNSDYVKILDFGIAKFKHDLEAFTGTGKMLGTPTYMAPEQMMNAKGVDRRADLYSLGCILFALLHGRPPFTADNLYELIAKVQQSGRPNLAALQPEVPTGLAAIVSRLMTLDPAGRFEDCASLRAALLPYAGRPSLGTGLEIEDTEPAQTSPVRVPRRAWRWAVAAGAVLLATVSGLVVVTRHAPEPRRPAPIEPRPAPNAASIVTLPSPIVAPPSKTESVLTPDVPAPLPPPRDERSARRRLRTEQPSHGVTASAPLTVQAPQPAPVVEPTPPTPVQPVATLAPTAPQPTPVDDPMGLPPPRPMPGGRVR